MSNLMFKEFLKKDEVRRGLWLNILALCPFSHRTEGYCRKI